MAKCRTCDSEIRWIQEQKKWIPLNLDGVKHWSTCGQLKPVNNSKPARETSSGVIIGANYTGDGCTCGLLPWELCRPDCEHGIGNH